MRMPGNVMSGIASRGSRRLEMTPMASTASATITVVTGRRNAILVCSMAVPVRSAGRRLGRGVPGQHRL